MRHSIKSIDELKVLKCGKFCGVCVCDGGNALSLQFWLPSWTREQVTELSDDDKDQEFPSNPSDYLSSDSD